MPISSHKVVWVNNMVTRKYRSLLNKSLLLIAMSDASLVVSLGGLKVKVP